MENEANLNLNVIPETDIKMALGNYSCPYIANSLALEIDGASLTSKFEGLRPLVHGLNPKPQNLKNTLKS